MILTPTEIQTLEWCLDRATPKLIRPITQWVEDELILPDGPYKGERYKHSRHPVSRLWFEQIDSGQWTRFAATGPTQNGKTLMCYVAPVLYQLFEIGETVIIGLPTMQMAQDKWVEDLLPAIEASRYRDLIPTTGEGSRGGMVKRAVKFRNGATLRFMTAGGGDKQRAGFTSRVLAITETDGMDAAGEASREADPIEQLEGRTRAFGRLGKRVYMECTVSIEQGRIWQEYTRGTESRIVRPCPHCGEYVAPEREHLIGWKDASSEHEAADLARWSCPECEEPWTEEQRHAAAQEAVLVHRGQEVSRKHPGSIPKHPESSRSFPKFPQTAPKVVGDPPKTQTLGFRWSAIDNPFVTAADLGAEEWLAAKQTDRENTERKMRQFVWCLPYEPPELELTPLDPEELNQRTDIYKQGVIPDGAVGVAVGVDTGKRRLHWEAKAVMPDGGTRVIEYGCQEVDSDKLGVTQGLVEALANLMAYFESGWQCQGGTGSQGPRQVWIDSGYHEHTDAVYQFCAAANKQLGLGYGSERYRPSKGYGEAQKRMARYSVPRGGTGDIVFVGREFHVAKVRRNKRVVPGVLLVHMNADFWKSELHQRLAMPQDEPLACRLYESPSGHTEWAHHMTAERQIEQFIPGRGPTIVWEYVRRDNHYLDAGYAALCAAEFVVAMQVEQAKRKPPKTLAQMREEAMRKRSQAR